MGRAGIERGNRENVQTDKQKIDAAACWDCSRIWNRENGRALPQWKGLWKWVGINDFAREKWIWTCLRFVSIKWIEQEDFEYYSEYGSGILKLFC